MSELDHLQAKHVDDETDICHKSISGRSYDDSTAVDKCKSSQNRKHRFDTPCYFSLIDRNLAFDESSTFLEYSLTIYKFNGANNILI